MSTGFRIAFFGSSLVSAYWNGAATYYRGIISALHSRGHTITFFEPDAYNRQEHRDIADPGYARSVVYAATGQGVEGALSQATDFDIVVKTSGVGVFDELLEREVLRFRSGSTRVIFWDVDAPATLDRIRKNPGDTFRTLIPQYDYILTYGGGDPVVKAYREFGARNCHPIYNALDPSTHYPVPCDSRFEGTLGFLGNRLPDREERVNEFFFKPARALPRFTFLLGGNGWEHHVPELTNVKRFGHIYTHEHNPFNCSVTAVLNVNRQSMAANGFSPATRVFEAAGAGACIITDAWEGLESFLEPSKECLSAENGEQVIDYLQNLKVTDAKMIGIAARKRILSEHTYASRAEVLERILWQNTGDTDGGEE